MMEKCNPNSGLTKHKVHTTAISTLYSTSLSYITPLSDSSRRAK